MNIIKLFTPVPLLLFNNVLAEINQINWKLILGIREKIIEFADSNSIHLRINYVNDATFSNIHSYGKIGVIQDTIYRPNFLEINNLIEWVMKSINGISLGRIMIVKLKAGGIIADHIDEGEYFKKYSRFHIPIITNELVTFHSEHMPVATLSCLNNIVMHGAKNKGTTDRIHIIMDIESADKHLYFR